ncbi:MAG: hypothetical protein IIX27_00600 [Ruminococcus sp.]|nr:hypothetical protein [Ruminococcus sp.]
MRSCTFIGHKDCPQEIKEKLCETVEDLIVNSDVRRFYVGTHGSFDRLAYKVLCDFESKYEIEIIVVLSYLYHKKDVYYDLSKTVFPEEVDKADKKYAIVRRNEFMIKRSQVLVCYVNNMVSNSYKYMTQALKKGLRVINISDVV